MKTVYDPIFKTWVSAFIDANEVRAKSKIEKLIDESLEGMAFESQAKTVEYKSSAGGQRIIMWFRKNDLSLLAHELVHVIEYSFELRRIPLGGNAEVIAYYMEYLFREFEPLFKGKKGK